MFGAIILGTTQNASANTGTDTINDDTIESLPEGVEKYYPRNPELLVDENYEDPEGFEDFITIKPYVLEQLPRNVYLTKTDKSKSTSRLQLYNGDNLGMNVEPKKFGKKGKITGIIYRNGEYYAAYIFYKKERFVYTVKTGDLSEYSLRLYCGYPNDTDLETGCQADGTIYPVK